MYPSPMVVTVPATPFLGSPRGRQRKAERPQGMWGHFLISPAWLLLVSLLGMGCPHRDLSNGYGTLDANISHHARTVLRPGLSQGSVQSGVSVVLWPRRPGSGHNLECSRAILCSLLDCWLCCDSFVVYNY